EATDVGQRLDENGCLDGRRRRAHGYNPMLVSPAVSSSPRATLAAWIAPPEAPLVRLSIAQIATTHPVRGSKRAVICAALEPSVALVAGDSGPTLTKGSPA